MALQTHINDIMMKRLTAQKAQAAGTAGSAPAAAPATSEASQGGGRGPQYEAHISSMQSKLDSANNRCLTELNTCGDSMQL